MAYSTIYKIFDNSFRYYGFCSERPLISLCKRELNIARKTNKAVLVVNSDAVAFPDNYKIDSEITLSINDPAYNIERTGYHYISSYDMVEAVILNVQELMVLVSIPVKRGFFQSLIFQSVLKQTHTISCVGKSIKVSGKFKFNEGFLEVDDE